MVEQKRVKSGVMIRGIIVLILYAIKSIYGYEFPDEIVDTIVEIALTGYGLYAVGNSPRIKDEY